MHKLLPTSRRLMPPLSALVAFEAAARLGSFTRAAEELSLTQSAISRRVIVLEELIGMCLFERVRNTVFLTPVGSFYAERVQNTLADLATATQEASLFLGRGGLLRLGMPPTFGTRWLIPRINAFLEAHRDVEIVFSTWLPDDRVLNSDNLDAVIHWGRRIPRFSRADKLFDEKLAIVAHPDLATDIRSFKDLHDQTLLVHALRPTAWGDWFHAIGLDKDANQSMLSFSRFSMVLSAAADQLGFALVPKTLVERELASGELVQLFSDSSLFTDSVYFAFGEEGDSHEPLQLFRHWLLSQCSEA